VVPGFDIKNSPVSGLEEELLHHFQIGHVTIQVEAGDEDCEQVDC